MHKHVEDIAQSIIYEMAYEYTVLLINKEKHIIYFYINVIESDGRT